MLRHYVFLKYRDDTSDGHVTAFCERMLALRAYQHHPHHLAVMAFNTPFVADVGSVDFTSPPTDG